MNFQDFSKIPAWPCQDLEMAMRDTRIISVDSLQGSISKGISALKMIQSILICVDHLAQHNIIILGESTEMKIVMCLHRSHQT